MNNRDIEVPKEPKLIQPTKRTKASRTTDFQVYVRSTLPQDVPPDDKCNAPTFKGLCTMKAGHGTGGEIGRCRTHGKANPVARVPATSQSGIRGIYSQGKPTNLKMRYEQMLNDPEMLAVNSDMAMLKALMFEVVQSAEDPGILWESEEGVEKIKLLINSFEKVAKLGMKMKEIEAKSEFVITVPQFMKIIEQIVKIFKETCHDCPISGRVRKIQTRFASELDVTGKHSGDNVVEAEFDLEV